jgi:prolipoprotein diacylglyceryltransferase
MVYQMTRWENSTGGTVNFPLKVNRPQTYIVSYSSALNLPPIPGFPVEAIITGLSLGFIVMIMRRRRLGGTRYFSSNV